MVRNRQVDKNLKWVVGEIEITQIVEMEDNELFSTFIPEAKPKRIKQTKWLIPNFADEKGNLKAQVQTFVIRSNNKNILIDTGNGNGKKRPNLPTWSNLKTNFLRRLNNSGLPQESINVVVCTHLHFDHVGWNTKLENGKWVPTFPNAKYFFSREEYKYWIRKPEKEIIDDFNGIDDSVSPIVEAGLVEFIPDDYQIDENIRFIPTPGHTPHHFSVAIESRGEKAIISGDVLHHPCQIVHPEWTTLADTFPEQTIVTRKKFLGEIKNKDILLVGSHFSNPVVGKIVSEEEEYSFKF
jgi:glyoxylase-like metal-dependent hydrolase (beta-lactamase superfamily II)